MKSDKSYYHYFGKVSINSANFLCYNYSLFSKNETQMITDVHTINSTRKLKKTISKLKCLFHLPKRTSTGGNTTSEMKGCILQQPGEI